MEDGDGVFLFFFLIFFLEDRRERKREEDRLKFAERIN